MPKGTGVPAYREVTIPAVILGVILGSIMTAAFVYIGLKLGFTLAGSTVAAILGFAVLRGAMGKGTIVENNINQTVASGINNASAGVAFTLPALFLMKANDPTLDFVIGGTFMESLSSAMPFILAGIAGSFMGIVLIIPLRKQMIEFERLRFPSGIAVASLLKSPGAGMRQAVLLVSGVLIGTIFTTMAQYHLLPEPVDLGRMMGVPGYIPIAFGISFASLGAGLLSGKGGLPFVAGGVLAWWIISPLAVSMAWVPSIGVGGEDAWITGNVIFREMLRPLGIGILIGGAVAGVIASFPALRGALKGLSAVGKSRAGKSLASDEMPMKLIGIGLTASMVLLFGAALASSDSIGMGQAVAVAIVGTMWLAVAGLIVAQATGMTDISPLSGMSLIGVTVLFFLTAGNVLAAVTIGVAICIGIGQCADMMTDLKSGHLVGSVPRRQQTIQFAVAWIGVPIAVGAVYLYWQTPGFGPGQDLSAPQGQALQAVIESLRSGDVALDKYLAGIVLGCCLGIFPISGVAVLVGLAMYLPFYITVTYGIGCIVSIAIQRKKGARWMGNTMVPLAAGFIIGEALPSLVISIIKATG